MKNSFPSIASDYKECHVNFKNTLVSMSYGQKIYQASDDTHYFVVDINRKPGNYDTVLVTHNGVNTVGVYMIYPRRIKLTPDVVLMGRAIRLGDVIGVISSVVADKDNL